MKTTLIKRVKAYLIDLCFLGIALFAVSLFATPLDVNDKLIALNSNYLLGNVSFSDYLVEIGLIYEEVDRSNIWNTIINMIYIILYFVIFPYYHQGQTIGKKLLNIKVRSMGNKEATLFQLFLRSLIITGLFYLFLILIALILPFNYFILISVFGFLQVILLIICMVMVFVRKDKRGLHDLIGATRVLDTK